MNYFGMGIAVVLLVFSSTQPPAAEQRGVVRFADSAGQWVGAYRESHALLIGESRYQDPLWNDLQSVPAELDQVEDALVALGFHVDKRLNLKSQQLEEAVKRFIASYGLDRDNRLLFFFSGHGHTLKTTFGREKGYIVPIDAPHPSEQKRGFKTLAVEMEQILLWARRIEAKHALFLFDSCFSGTVFKARGPLDLPREISELTNEPVRQFIAAGKADETVPAKSVFTPAFVDALKYRLADLDRDGFVTGTELGLHLRKTVSQHVDQTPQFGAIRDFDLSRGDFVFMVGTAETPATKKYSLTVETEPAGAQVRILNIVSPYHPGIRLRPGRYHIEVSQPGYLTHKEWIETLDLDRALVVSLKPESPRDPKIYDDFENTRHDGSFDRQKWYALDEVSGGRVTQSDGMLTLSYSGPAQGGIGLGAARFSETNLRAPMRISAKLKVDRLQEGHTFLTMSWDSPLNVYADCILGYGSKRSGMAGCGFSVNDEAVFETAKKSVGYGTWHTLDITVDPVTMTFTYRLNGEFLGEYTPTNADQLRKALMDFNIGLWSDGAPTLTGYIDDVHIGEVGP